MSRVTARGETTTQDGLGWGGFPHWSPSPLEEASVVGLMEPGIDAPVREERSVTLPPE